MSYVTDEYPILAITATSIRVVTTAIDLRKFERFSILFKNNNTAIAFTELQAQISINATVPDSAADVAQDWIAAEASSVNRVVDDLYTLQNGNINSANIIGSGVGAANLETSSVITRAMNNGSITVEKNDYGTIVAIQEIF